MAAARKETVVEGEEGLYHCISRCVRRAFLCGPDPYTGKSFDHRKKWVLDRLEFLASVFAIDVCAYAIMSNHLHVVIRTRPDLAEGWSDEETAGRWLALFPNKDQKGRPLPASEKEIMDLASGGEVGEKRIRLGGVSWFMRCLNESIARRANREDGCKGRFWEGRLKCQVLLDDSAVLACLAYVDLNPIRAGMADSPETSLFTSAHARILTLQTRGKASARGEKAGKPPSPPYRRLLDQVGGSYSDDWLCPFGRDGADSRRGILDISPRDYLTLIDWTGRQAREKASGSIPDDLDPILDRLTIDKDNWLVLAENFGSMFHRAVGKVGSLRKAARKAGRRWLQGLGASRAVFSTPPSM
ncbi:MAG: transposase [Pseudomonadota bacterium]